MSQVTKFGSDQMRQDLILQQFKGLFSGFTGDIFPGQALPETGIPRAGLTFQHKAVGRIPVCRGVLEGLFEGDLHGIECEGLDLVWAVEWSPSERMNLLQPCSPVPAGPHSFRWLEVLSCLRVTFSPQPY